jgi:LAO/AO transport system kinase
MRPDYWHPPIVKTIAIENKGIEDLAVAIQSYKDFQKETPESNLRRQSIARWRIMELLRETLLAKVLRENGTSEKIEALAAEVANKERDPYSAVDEILNS